MHLHHWLGWLAACLSLVWLGELLSKAPPEAVAMAAFDDGYVVPAELQYEGVIYPAKVAEALQ